MTITRRQTIIALTGAVAGALTAAGLARRPSAAGPAAQPPGRFEVNHSDAEWQAILTPEQFGVLRRHATERPGSSPLLDEHRAGTFHCAGCNHPLFAASTKYDSGTGWPSFYAPLPGAIGTQVDRTLFATRTEVHCARCGGHLGHVFNDGPAPTGLRYCMNGVALTFLPSMS